MTHAGRSEHRKREERGSAEPAGAMRREGGVVSSAWLKLAHQFLRAFGGSESRVGVVTVGTEALSPTEAERTG